jgi:hypothetical protein
MNRSRAPFFSTSGDSPPPAATNTSAQRQRRINPWRKFTGAMVPNWLLCRRGLSQGAKLCYARLCQHAGKKGFCWPGQEILAAELGVGERQVRSYLHELVAFKLITVEQRGLKKSNRYFFLDHPWIYENQPKTPRTAGLDRKNSSFPERQNGSAPYEWSQKKEESGRRRIIHPPLCALAPDSSGANGLKPFATSPEPTAHTLERQKIPRSEFTRSELRAQLKAATAAVKAHRLDLKWPRGQYDEHKFFQEYLDVLEQSPEQERAEYKNLSEIRSRLHRQLSGRHWRTPE